MGQLLRMGAVDVGGCVEMHRNVDNFELLPQSEERQRCIPAGLQLVVTSDDVWEILYDRTPDWCRGFGEKVEEKAAILLDCPRRHIEVLV